MKKRPNLNTGKLTRTATKRNYGVLTDASKDLNRSLGDKSGRTVSMRTAHGLKKSFNLNKMSDDTAEDIVHGAMIATTALLNSKDSGDKAIDAFMTFALMTFYQDGK
jgi:hypothetical protein